ncbi:MAG: glycoside hydrolase family 38 C-terminal domain-containing protein [Vulcanimicrobiota bacterium]
MGYKLFFVPHTHWEREWYKSLEVFRIGMVRMLDNLVDLNKKDGNFPFFTLDGQYRLVEDYLKIRPDKKKTLKKLIKEGKLVIGPWVVQPDLFQSEGEVIVRNLLEGIESSRKSGGYMNTLYIPESTGLITQLPQIMKNFHMNHLVFIRGLGDESVSTLYTLEGADGTSVCATYLVDAYNNAGFLPDEMEYAIGRIEEEVDNLKEVSPTDWLLMNHGGDHSSPQALISGLLEELRKNYDEVEAGSFDDFYKHIKGCMDSRKMPVLKGEVRGSRYYPILAGRISSRLPYKLNYYNWLDHLVNFAEPFAVMLTLQGREYPEQLFSRVWKLMLDNQQHNTASGSVIDQIEEEARIRVSKVKDLLELEWDESLEFLRGEMDQQATRRKKTPVYVINSLPNKRSGLVTVRHKSIYDKEKHICIKDENGNKVSYQLISSHIEEATYPYPPRTKLLHSEILLKVEDVPSFGHKVFYLVEEDKKEEIDIKPATFISNEFFQVGFEKDGSFYIKDLRTSYAYNKLNQFMDEADTGDLYNFSPLPGDISLSHVSQDLSMEILSNGKLQKTLQLRGNLSLPRSLSEDRKHRSEERVLCPFTLDITLYAGTPYLDCMLEVDNKAQDHRLSMVFPTESESNHIWVGQPFDLTRRSIVPPSGEGWIEVPPTFQPFNGILDIHSDKGSLAILSPGIYEYEVIPTPSGNGLRITLVRSVGWLSREDCLTRKVLAAPKVSTPAAQCIEKLNFNYALVPHKGAEDIKEVLKLYQVFKSPLRCISTSMDNLKPTSEDIIDISPSNLIVSAIKMSKAGETVIARFYNPLNENVETVINASAKKFSGVRKTDMMENTDEEFQEFPLTMTVKPKEIVTLEFK